MRKLREHKDFECSGEGLAGIDGVDRNSLQERNLNEDRLPPGATWPFLPGGQWTGGGEVLGGRVARPTPRIVSDSRIVD